MVLGEPGSDPRRGDGFVSVGRDRRRLTVLVWNQGGWGQRPATRPLRSDCIDKTNP